VLLFRLIFTWVTGKTAEEVFSAATHQPFYFSLFPRMTFEPNPANM
jgi:hypothetical protein